MTVSDTTDAFDMSLFTVQCRLNFNAMKKYCTAIIRNCVTTSCNDNYGGWLKVTINYFAAYLRNLTLMWQGHHSPSIGSTGGSDNFYYVLFLRQLSNGNSVQSSQSFCSGDPLANRSLLQCCCTTCEHNVVYTEIATNIVQFSGGCTAWQGHHYSSATGCK